MVRPPFIQQFGRFDFVNLLAGHSASTTIDAVKGEICLDGCKKRSAAYCFYPMWVSNTTAALGQVRYYFSNALRYRQINPNLSSHTYAGTNEYYTQNSSVNVVDMNQGKQKMGGIEDWIRRKLKSKDKSKSNAWELTRDPLPFLPPHRPTALTPSPSRQSSDLIPSLLLYNYGLFGRLPY